MGTGVEGDTDKDTDKQKKCVKKQQVERKVDTANTVGGKLQAEQKIIYFSFYLLITVISCFAGSTADLTDKRLSRQQWKNKMKNRKKCRNKFLLRSEEGKLGGGLVQELLITGKTQNDDFRMVSLEKIADVPSSTDTSDQAKVKKNTRRSNGSKTNVRNQREKEKPLNVDKKSRLQDEKLSLSIHATENDVKLRDAHLKQEKVDFRKDSECLTDRSSTLRSRMEKRLQSARFRYINEQLYTSSSGEAKRMFKQDPDAIRIYHIGYSEQVKHWPANPVDSIIAFILRR